MENNIAVRLYEDDTEKCFESYDDAVEYAAYLVQKLNISVDTYEKVILAPGELDIAALKKQDALDKLTEEEKALLGISNGETN